jgi:signal transduction histidine kinase
MALLLLGSGAFIYERMQFALDRSIHDVPQGDRAEINARRRHRNEALDELLAQLAVAYGATLAVAGFVGYRMTRAALGPVEAMQRQAASHRGAPGVRLEVPATDDELARLAATLNDLLESSERAVAHERRFVADASHELRTPLTLLKLQIDLALSRERSREDLRHALERAQAEADRLIRLANDLLILALADDGMLELEVQRVDARAALAETAARFQERAQRTGRRILVPDDAEAALAVDPDRVQQVLSNLIDNALTHGRGDVELTCRGNGRFAELRVIDHGPGFAPEFTPRALDRFATTSESRTGGGAGLGLAIAKAIVQAHGGEVRLGNREMEGAEVAVTLPLAETSTD